MAFFSCSSDDEPIFEPEGVESRAGDLSDASSLLVEENVSALTKATAEFLSTSAITYDMVKGLHNVVSQGLDLGLEEGAYFTELLASNNGVKKVAGFGDYHREIVDFAKLFEVSSISNYALQPAQIETLKKNSYQIYWPYSENWDGKTMPVIAFVPEDQNAEIITAYKIDGGKLVPMLVDENYAENNPVWIINKSDIPYEELPNFSNNELVQDGVAYLGGRCDEPGPVEIAGDKPVIGGGKPPVIQPLVMSVYLGGFMADHQYDSWIAGGSEFDITMAQYSGPYIIKEEDFNSKAVTVTTLRITRSRKDIKNKKWIYFDNCVLISEWFGNENNAAFQIIESDGGSKKNFESELTLTLAGKSFGYKVNLPFQSHDERIYRTVYTHNFIRSSNNNPNVPFEASGVHWTLPWVDGTIVDKYQ